ncbi:MAG: DNA cytosine methyltransferase [Armatimonadetes bacterium]|nr:DNA cytosine methyltransferase [Armatimonadota bacterium]
MKDAIEFVSLFSGCGGLDLGLHQAGFRSVYANEHDARVVPTYRKNFPDTPVTQQDIRTLDASTFPAARGIVGSPPCQSWSAAGAQRGASDPRGQLFFLYCDIIAARRPEFFIAENVAGMLEGKKAEAFQYLVGQLQHCGYHVSYDLVDCADYGVPQNRKRVFLVGLRSDMYESPFEFPLPVAERATLASAIGDLPSATPVGRRIETCSAVPNHEYGTGGWSSHFMSRQRVRSWDEPSYTIPATGRHIPLHPSANKMVPAGKDKFVFDESTPVPYRRLSVRECARIQTFPDDFLFEYDNVDSGYLMVGNAVPVLMGKVIGEALAVRLAAGK